MMVVRTFDIRFVSWLDLLLLEWVNYGSTEFTCQQVSRALDLNVVGLCCI
jgi:hypothetical protein